MMNKTLTAIAVAIALPFTAFATEVKSTKAGADQTCGEKLAETAKYPKQLSETLASVARMHNAHADWMNGQDKPSREEARVMRELAKQHQQLSRDADKLASTLTRQKDLLNAPHDMKAMPASLRKSMEEAASSMEKFSTLLADGAREMRDDMKAMQGQMGTGGAGTEGELPESEMMPREKARPGR